MFNKTRQGLNQTIIKPRYQMRWVVFQIPNINPNLNYGMVSPHIGATEMLNAQDLDGFI